MIQRPRVLLATVAMCAASLLIAGCGDDSGGSVVTTSTSAAPLTSTTVPAATTTTLPSGQVVEVTFRDGNVEGPSQVEAEVDDTLTLRVTSDVAEEIHVHTFDLSADLEPGVPAEITFVAGIPGRHEVELEDSGKRLFTLVVEP